MTEDTAAAGSIPTLTENERKLSSDVEKLKEQVTNLSEKNQELDVSRIVS